MPACTWISGEVKHRLLDLFFPQNWSCNKSSGPLDLLCQVKALKKDNTTEAAAAGCWSIQQDN